MTNIVLQKSSQEPGCLVQALWFIFVGWWLGGVLVAAAWALNATIVLLPLGIIILNNIPKALALQDPVKYTAVALRGNSAVVVESDLPSTPSCCARPSSCWWAGGGADCGWAQPTRYAPH